MKGQILVELLAAAKGTQPEPVDDADMRTMLARGASLLSPALVRRPPAAVSESDRARAR